MMKPNTIIHLQYLKASEEGVGGVEEEELTSSGIVKVTRRNPAAEMSLS